MSASFAEVDESIDIQRVVSAVSLESVRLRSLHSERVDTNDPIEETSPPEWTFSFDVGESEPRAFRVSLGVTYRATIGSAGAIAEAEYLLSDFAVPNVSDEVLSQFVNQVAMMTLVPYVREAVANASMRVFNSPLLMPLLKAGELHFSVSRNVATQGSGA